jgi:NADH-quinone oxidoreductase subunit L
MGGLSAHMKWTTRTFAVGTLALTGCPLLAGFFSKDAILAAALNQSTVLFLIGLATAVLTAFYMTRLFVVAFLGKPRSEAAQHGHDCSFRMTAPLCILAVLSVIAGYGTSSWFMHAHEGGNHVLVMFLATGAFAAGTFGGWVVYKDKEREPLNLPLFRNKFYFDEIYSALVSGTQDVIAYIANFVDAIISGFVRILGMATWVVGFGIRYLQFGNLQGYAFVFGLGVVALIYFLVFR